MLQQVVRNRFELDVSRLVGSTFTAGDDGVSGDARQA